MEIKQLYGIFSEYTAICTDSRNIVPDSIFFALKGENFDGNRYVKQALEMGCAFAVSDDESNDGIPGCILVENVLKTLSALAEHHRRELNVRVLAITGTNGKTTTKELVDAVLSKKYKTVSTKGNLNNHIGVPLTLLSIPWGAEFAVVETGANHLGEIASLCETARPDCGIITNIGKAHLEGFGSPDGVKKAKGELYDFLEKNRGTIFYNADDDILKTMAENRNGVTLVGYGEKIMDVKIAENTFLEFFSSQPELHVKTSLVGRYNLNNALAAIAVGLHFDVPETDIVAALSACRPDNNRSQLIETAKNTIIMDAYNANPSSMEAALGNFHRLDRENKLLILGDMLELGENSRNEHEQVIELIKKLGFENVILIGSNFYALKDRSSAKYFPDRTAAEEYLKNNNPVNQTILIKGSRGISLEKLIAGADL